MHDHWAWPNAQCPITNECPMPNDECHDRPSSREWGPGTAEALSGRATSAGKQRHGPPVIGHWLLVIDWTLVIGRWSLAAKLVRSILSMAVDWLCDGRPPGLIWPCS